MFWYLKNWLVRYYSFQPITTFFLRNYLFISLVFGLNFLSCNSFRSKEQVLFERVSSAESGVKFVNKITESLKLNSLNFDYIYNGGGVAVGDVNQDGLMDIYFTGNMVSGALYLNKGDFKFEDITKSAGVSTNRWTTGVSMIDINSDGWLDIYICVAGPAGFGNMENLLYINNHNNTFTESAKKYGLADSGYSTHAAFLDYDLDGDLDMYLLTNALEKFNRNFRRPRELTGRGASTDRLYRNNGNGTFSNVSKEAGITIEGYGLGVCVSDINKDGYPDIYVANDFLSNDLLWINNKNGTFTNRIKEMLQHQSYNGMGTDIADLNNDGFEEIMVLDMLPEDNLQQKTMLMPGNYDTFLMNIQLGYEPQYVRNSLQLNNGNGTYSEIGQLAGVSKTDWSWGPLFADFDNDGYRDIFITNGYRKDVTNLDFVTNTDVSPFGDENTRRAEAFERLKQVQGKKLHNYIYYNNRDLTFTDKSEAWGLHEPSYSNGGAYADFDNDGDLDLVVNNIDDEAFIYRSKARSELPQNNYLRLAFEGPSLNKFGIGVSVKVETASKTLVYEHYPHKGYKATVDQIAHFGLGADSIIRKLTISWPDGKREVQSNIEVNRVKKVFYTNATTLNIQEPLKTRTIFEEIPPENIVSYQHEEMDFKDFNMQFLLPRRYSQDGPGMAAGDVNGDGLEDFFIGGAANYHGELFMQQKNGKFSRRPLGGGEKPQEDMGVLLFDADSDGDLDLYIASGGNEYDIRSGFYKDQLFKNDGKGNFTLDKDAVPGINSSGSCVTAADIDRDGDLDLFVGGRLEPNQYPLATSSFILRNDHGRFSNVTSKIAPELINIGLITSSLWTDFNNDGFLDLVVVGEWMPPSFFENRNGKLTRLDNIGLKNTEGWWNSINAGDFDRDGDIDYVAGNLGLNSKYKSSENEPVSVYAKDFDENGTLDPILSLYIQGKEYPTHPRDELVSQMPKLKKKLYRYDTYGKSTVSDIFSNDDLEGAYIVRAKSFQSVYIENLGKGQFQMKALPMLAQVSPIFGTAVGDYDFDGVLDVLLIGNSHATEVLTGWYDAGIGLYLKGNGHGGFIPINVNRSGFMVKGDGKSMITVRAANGSPLVLALSNKGPLQIFKPSFHKSVRALKLDSDDASAVVQFSKGKTQKFEFYYGNGYLSQSSRVFEVPPGAQTLSIIKFNGKRREINIASL